MVNCDEVIVCMVLAFCIGSAIITLAYRLRAGPCSTLPEGSGRC